MHEQFDSFFRRATRNADASGGFEPRSWQRELASSESCRNRLIRIPTGLGKTLGVLITWLWHAVERRDSRWPRRLVICLPMRVLVEQTHDEIRRVLGALDLIWDGQSDHNGKVGLHVLMGGADQSSEWYLYLEHFAVLVCTQDLALSAALNRGYTVPRARWPSQFGLFNQDALWVMDEVQLMDVGMATSGQLQAFREDEQGRGRGARPCATWWMSATLQSGWLRKSPDTRVLTTDLAETRIRADQRTGHLWTDVTKLCRLERVTDERDLAASVSEAHRQNGLGKEGLSLIVMNTVERAVSLYQLLSKDQRQRSGGVDVVLVHSRFRPAERQRWRERFLNREACQPGTNRIIVATQVIEAGVDISASLLITELSPWPSLVQRFGRCARWGGQATVMVADFDHKDDQKAAPYRKHELDAARKALEHLDDVAPLHLEAFEDAHPELLDQLYPYEPRHLLLRHELDDLFDTAPDLSGADVDISRFIRSGDERDVRVFWVDVPENAIPSSETEVLRDGLCAVPFLKAREWLFEGKGDSLRGGKRAWAWDWVNGTWTRAAQRHLFPGQSILVSSDSGGYDAATGWAPRSKGRVPTVSQTLMPIHENAREQADAQEEHEGLSVLEETGSVSSGSAAWQTIAVHGRDVGGLARSVALDLAPVFAQLVDLAGRWHDLGKAHTCFDRSIVQPRNANLVRPDRHDLAKAPQEAWLPVRRLYPMPDGTRRAGYRHELASTLGLFGVLERHQPDHPALLGPWREFLTRAGFHVDQPTTPTAPPTSLEREVLELDADGFNLLAYLVCTHHGKVRVSWQSSPADQESASQILRIRGVEDGDRLPAVVLTARDGSFQLLPECTLRLSAAGAGLNPRTGTGWTERVLGLLDRYGPFTLAWLEALMIAADRRASRRTDIQDPLLDSVHQSEVGR
jgi:CRISPR-associated endonuclease/helicase Cas3